MSRKDVVVLSSHMEPQINEPESVIAPLKKVTPLSKYLAMALFVALPFIGGWIGYMYAPEKVVEIERIVEKIVIKESPNLIVEESQNNFPVIAFEGEELLTISERELLNEKFIEPYVDYYQMLGDSNLLTTVIEVPKNAGEPYLISVVMSDGNNGGFLFGKKGEDFNYWFPGCFDECKFTEEYRLKYPEVVELYKISIAP